MVINSFISCTNNEKEDKNTIVKFLLLSNPSIILLLYLIDLLLYTLIKPLLNEEVLMPTTPSSLYHHRK